jgi:pilus assembly protein Flp/PilA
VKETDGWPTGKSIPDFSLREEALPDYFFSGKEISMEKIKNAVRTFIEKDEGAALAEYGILVAFIAIVAIVAVTFFGSKISAKFSQLANSYS